ncbi:MAG TPA: hypothetical protein VMW48_09650, partial [Vicinamibacterales bacterium]|nr:hypothetical protein [Vicinamibacterales bacterium]
ATDANGDYAFTDLMPGTYSIAEVLQEGWTQTYPGGGTVIDFEVLRHDDAEIVEHGFQYIEDGFVLDNLSANPFATFGTLESRFSGSTALLNDTVNGVTRLTALGGSAFDLVSIDLTELNGSNVANVTFTGYLAGGGTVSQTFTLDGVAFYPETFVFTGFGNLASVEWTQEDPFHQFDNITIGGGGTGPGWHRVELAAGEVVEDVDFGNWAGGRIEGVKWYDADQNGAMDAGEPGLPGWVIFLDDNDDGVLDWTDGDGDNEWDEGEGEQWSATDANGDYVLTGLLPGSYTVAEVLQAGWEQTYPGGGVFYATDRTTDTTYTVDPITGAAAVVGPIGYNESYSGLSYDGGPLYCSDLHDGSWTWCLGTVDTTTGAGTLIGAQGDSDIHALAHVGGTLYGFSLSQYMGPMDTTTGQITSLWPTPVDFRGADLDESTGILYCLGGDNQLWTMDVATGATAVVGPTGVDFNYRMGLAYNPIDQQLYALGDDDSSGGGDNLYRINKATGAATLVGNTGLTEADALEFVGFAGSHTVTVALGETVEDVNFGNWGSPGDIRGAKWLDADQDGQWDAGEPGLAGWVIFLDGDDDGVLDWEDTVIVNGQWDEGEGEQWTATDANGDYVFTNLIPGTYVVEEVLQSGWTRTYPSGGGMTADFEDAAGDFDDEGFTLVDDSDAPGTNLWHGTQHRSTSPTWSMYYGIEGSWNFETGARNAGYLYSPPIPLSPAGPISLSFDYFLAGEGGDPYDEALVEISADGGLTWTTIAANGGLGLQDNTGAWITWSGDISAYAGNEA